MKKLYLLLREKHADVFKIILFVLAVVVIVYNLPKEGKFKYEYKMGKVWMNPTLIAPFDFAIYKSKEELKRDKKIAKTNTHPYFTLDSAVAKIQINIFELTFDSLTKLNNNSIAPINKTIGSSILMHIYSQGVIETNEQLDGQANTYTVNVLTNNQLNERELSSIYTLQTAYDYVNNQLGNNAAIVSLIENALKHNIKYDAAMTDKTQDQSQNDVSPTHGMVKQGDPIITKGEVTDDLSFQMLESLKSQYSQKISSRTNYWLILVGQCVLVSVCIALLFLFLTLFRKDIIADNNNVTFILICIVINVVMTAVTLRTDIISLYVLPYCILPVMMRVFYDTRTALFTHIVSCLIVGLVVPNSFEFFLLQLIAGMVTIFSIVNMRNRSQLFVAVMYIFLAYSITYFGLSIVQQGRIDSVEPEYFGLFAVSSMITLFSYPLIYVCEKVFGFLSDISLLELTDTNSKLLRSLSEKAPGTFQHSLQVANLAEDAIHAIGGSPLLVRAGALYHDIGKITSPVYFIENQTTGVNPHDDISSEESATIITGHVKAGIELAKKNNLPDRIIDFIRTHHGTSKVQYFYQSYLKIHPDEKIDETLFQYPGPIPFSKETAVLMMADSVEASSRSLKQYNAETISALVNKIINKQIDDEQFINSDITFKNISTIKKIFIKKLLNIYHLRIEYPNK
ncbi:MAG: HDIG domain-containing protein [Bacteroidia bacterium]|nr:HDIG domain-containing protein [Bacteroidia bacterium]